MFPYELLDLSTVISSRIDTHWTLFITVHLALIGGIIYIDKPLQKFEKLFAGLIYSGFALANYLMMEQQAILLDSVYQDIYVFSEMECCSDSAVIQRIAVLVESGFRTGTSLFVRIAHVSMFLVVIVSILYDKPSEAAAE